MIGKWENYEVFAYSREHNHKYLKYIKSKAEKKVVRIEEKAFCCCFRKFAKLQFGAAKSRERLRRGFFPPPPNCQLPLIKSFLSQQRARRSKKRNEIFASDSRSTQQTRYAKFIHAQTYIFRYYFIAPSSCALAPVIKGGMGDAKKEKKENYKIMKIASDRNALKLHLFRLMEVWVFEACRVAWVWLL